MITGETQTGFKFEIDEAALDDWELLDALSEVDNGNMKMLTKIPVMLLGVEQAKSLKEHLREPNGRVPATKMSAAIKDIFTHSSNNSLKN